MSLPHHRTMTANLRRLYRRATPEDVAQGSAWYPNARKIVAEWSTHYGYPVETVACVIAAISPQCPWERNLIIADDVLAGRAPSIGAIRLNVVKAQRLRDETGSTLLAHADERMARHFPGGPKVTCFAANLAGDSSLVTVDTHAAQAAIGDPIVFPQLRWNRYALIAHAYIDVAHSVGLTPADFQAILWVTWKRIYPAANKRSIQRRYVS